MPSIAEPLTASRIAALTEERDELMERIEDLADQAESEALAGRMDRWAVTRQRIRPLAERLGEIREDLAVIQLTSHPKRTQSEWVTR